MSELKELREKAKEVFEKNYLRLSKKELEKLILSLENPEPDYDRRQRLYDEKLYQIREELRSKLSPMDNAERAFCEAGVCLRGQGHSLCSSPRNELCRQGFCLGGYGHSSCPSPRTP